MGSVYVTKRVNVYPKIMQPPKILKLSNLDRQCPTLMYLVFFYDKPFYGGFYGSHDNNDYIFSSLKGSLEDTLSLWYPAAGRLTRNPSDGKLDLWCNNEGAIMVEAVTQARVSDLGDDLSQYNDFFESLVYKPSFNGNISEMPLLVAQVTRFACGGYAVGVGASHSLFDGQATFNFLSAWASNLQRTKGVEWNKPLHGRERLMLIPNSQRNPKNKNPAIAMARVSAIQHLYQLITQSASDNSGMMMMKMMKNNPQVFVPSIDHEDCVLHTFHLSGLMIDNLKKRIYGLNYSISSSCSSFEVVAAHLWKARTKALGLRRDRMVCLQFSVDTRTRLAPQMPQGFSGNAYVLASIALSAGELETMSYEAIINKIKAAKNSVDNEYVSSYLEALEGSGGALPPLRELTMVSDWTRTPYHKLNFMPPHSQAPHVSNACPLAPPLPHVAYFMQSAKEDKGIDVRIGLSPQILSSFSHYFLQTLN